MIYSPGDVIPSSAGCRPTTVPVVERVADKKHLIVYDSSGRNCVVCSTSESRKRTNFKCSGCGSQPYLHPKVFCHSILSSKEIVFFYHVMPFLFVVEELDIIFRET